MRLKLDSPTEKEDKLLVSSIISSINKLLKEYFSIGGPKKEQRRYLLEEADKDSRVGIADIRNADEAFCTEYAVVAHNLLNILGIQNKLTSGVRQTTYYGPNTGKANPKPQVLHAYIIVKIGQDEYIYDPPYYINTEEGKKKVFFKRIQEDANGKLITWVQSWNEKIGCYIKVKVTHTR